MSPFLCRIGWHSWEKWGDVMQVTGERRNFYAGVQIGEPYEYTEMIQHRACNQCGYTQERRVR